MPLPQATLHGAAGIAVPTLVSTLAISCVFVSVVFLHGPAKYLFTPLGLAVVFAMLASYGLSRTLTPITIGLAAQGRARAGRDGQFARLVRPPSSPRSSTASSACAPPMRELLHALLDAPHDRADCRRARARRLAACCSSWSAATSSRSIDGGQIQLHVRAPAGTRIEKTEQIFQAVEDKIREVIPENDRELIVDNIGLPRALLQSRLRRRHHDRPSTTA